ncbi:helix-turn-helix transcriptional regulator [bacterium]|nr:helix-turn-helix transcriptional regulator [bacterium]
MNKEKIVEIFSANLRAERARKKYTQEQLAEVAEITTEYLSKIENGKACPTILVITNIALALGVNIDKLLPLDELRN